MCPERKKTQAKMRCAEVSIFSSPTYNPKNPTQTLSRNQYLELDPVQLLFLSS